LLGALAASWRLVRAIPRGVEVRRRLPARVFAGEPFPITVELTNTRKRLGSWAVVVQEDAAGEGGPGGKAAPALRAFFAYVPPRQTCRQTCFARLEARGRYHLGPLRIWSRFPFGLLRHTITLARSETLVVYPRLGRLARGWLERYHAAALGDGGGRRPGRASNEFYGVREWRSGDSLRRLHWRASARHAKPVVRQLEQPGNRDLTVLVDLWQPPEPSAAELAHVERAVSFAATVVAAVCSQGRSNLALGIVGRASSWTSDLASAPRMEQALGQLAVAQAASGDGLPELLRRALQQAGPDEVLVISTRDREGDGLGWLAGAGVAPARCAPGRRVRVIHAAGPELGEYFRVD
jgi:uncharacterized protein (DUF58 family)